MPRGKEEGHSVARLAPIFVDEYGVPDDSRSLKTLVSFSKKELLLETRPIFLTLRSLLVAATSLTVLSDVFSSSLLYTSYFVKSSFISADDVEYVMKM